MKKYNFSREEIFRRAFKITDRIQKRMDTNVTVQIILPEPSEKKMPAIDAAFVGEPQHINQSRIEITIKDADQYAGKKKLRRWNAGLIIATIHEICHYKVFQKMTQKEREASNTYYNVQNVWTAIEETVAWVDTLYWLKRLRYHRVKTILEELRHFFPMPKKLACVANQKWRLKSNG